MKKLSVLINTFNEEKNIQDAIKSVKDLADEIIVIDMESSDLTVKLAKSLGAKVYRYKKMGYVEPARNFGISKASGDWVLILDADEKVPQTLSKKIKLIVNKPNNDYFRIPRKNIIFGRWIKHSRWWPDYNIRLFKKGTVSWNEIIHSVPMTQGMGGEIEAKEDLAIIHNNYSSVEEYIERMNRYSSIQAKVRINEGYKFSWKDLIIRPSQEFVSRYFFGEGYKDGIHGLALSFLQAFSELTLYLKIWQEDKYSNQDFSLVNVVKVMRDEEKELHFWQGDSLYKESGRFTDRIKRKLRL